MLEHTKCCDQCRYCVQTDKTGQRPLSTMMVAGEPLCPYYPGFCCAILELDAKRVSQIIALLQDIEAIATELKAKAKAAKTLSPSHA